MNKKLQILVCLPEVPTPPRSGGQRVFLNNLVELAQDPHLQVDVVILDSDGGRRDDAKAISAIARHVFVFDRELPRLDGSYKSRLKAIASVLFGKAHRAYEARRSSAATSEIRRLMRQNEYDLIIAEHLTSLAFVPFEFYQKAVLVAHNVEANVAKDNFLFSEGSLVKKMVCWIEWRKTKKVERMALRSVAKVIALNDSDAKSLSGSAKEKCTIHFPVIPTSAREWAANGNLELLFVGAWKYFPNLDAINWLCLQLAPSLKCVCPNAKIMIVSAPPNNLLAPDNVRFTGFVSSEELERLYAECQLFICPIRLGSGVKIKLLEAVAAGMPVIATQISLDGIEPLSDVPRLSLENPDLAAKEIALLLNDAQMRIRISQEIQRKRKVMECSRINLGEKLRGLIHE